MPEVLRSRAALVALLAALLIPIALSSLRGLTHVLTCADEVDTPFTIVFGDGDPIVLSSATLVAGDDPGLCGGLLVDMQAAAASSGRAELTLILTNATEFPWRGTVTVAMGGSGPLGPTLLPIRAGRVEPGERLVETLELRLGEGMHEIDGRLLIGP